MKLQLNFKMVIKHLIIRLLFGKTTNTTKKPFPNRSTRFNTFPGFLSKWNNLKTARANATLDIE